MAKKAAAKKATRTTHRSAGGKKLYAKRKADGTFSDIQSYEKAHRTDISKRSKAEMAARQKTAMSRPMKKKG